MKLSFTFGLVICCIVILSNSSFSDAKSLQYEEKMSIPKKITYETTLNYINIHNIDKNITNFPITFGNNEYTYIPILSDKQKNNDIIVVSPTLRYGISSTVEVFTTAGYIMSWQRGYDEYVQEIYKENSSDLSTLSGGISYKIKDEDTTPAHFFSISSNLFEKFGISNYKFKTFNASLLTYKTIDPLVLSIYTSYQLNLPKDNFKPGNIIDINPGVEFIINPDLNIGWSIDMSFKGSDMINNKSIGINESSISYKMDLSYSIQNNASLYFESTHFNYSNYDQNNFSVRIIRKY